VSSEKFTDDPVRAIEWLREIEAAAAEIVEAGDLLFARGKPSDPGSLRRYELYMRVKAAVRCRRGRSGWRRCRRRRSARARGTKNYL
jgi:hypothetical protein